MLYVVPSTVSVSPSFVHVTVVAGETVEVQVRVCVPESYVRLDTVGGAVYTCTKYYKLLGFLFVTATSSYLDDPA